MAKIIKLGGKKNTTSGSKTGMEPCRICHGTGMQSTPKKKK